MIPMEIVQINDPIEVIVSFLDAIDPKDLERRALENMGWSGECSSVGEAMLLELRKIASGALS